MIEFKSFKSGQEYQEYIHIFCYAEIFLNGTAIANINIENYNAFELTDKIVEEYNHWVNSNCPERDTIEKWFSLKKEEYETFKENFGVVYHPKVVLWSDRKKTSYYKEKLQDSFIFENYIAKLLQEQYSLDLGQYLTPQGQYDLGENALGIEIKNDTLISKWGNVYIEYQEKSKASNEVYINSGILKDDNCIYFLTGTKEKFYIFKKQRLIEIFNEELKIFEKDGTSSRGIKFKQISTSKGFVYPVKNAISDTITMDQMVDEIKKA